MDNCIIYVCRFINNIYSNIIYLVSSVIQFNTILLIVINIWQITLNYRTINSPRKRCTFCYSRSPWIRCNFIILKQIINYNAVSCLLFFIISLRCCIIIRCCSFCGRSSHRISRCSRTSLICSFANSHNNLIALDGFVTILLRTSDNSLILVIQHVADLRICQNTFISSLAVNVNPHLIFRSIILPLNIPVTSTGNSQLSIVVFCQLCIIHIFAALLNSQLCRITFRRRCNHRNLPESRSDHHKAKKKR